MKKIILFAVIFFNVPKANAWCFKTASEEFDIDPKIIYAIAKHESSLRPWVVNKNKNRSIDVGLMQINSIHEKELDVKGIEFEELFDPCKNIIAGTWILRKNIDRANGDVWRGVGYYHSRNPVYNYRYIRRIKAVYNKLKSEDIKIIHAQKH